MAMTITRPPQIEQLALPGLSSVKTPAPATPAQSFRTLLNDISATWDRTRSAESLPKALPAQFRQLLYAQQLAQRLHVQVEVVSRMADAVGSGIRRLQQLGVG